MNHQRNSDSHITRRQFGVITGGALASVALGIACRHGSRAEAANDGRLTARPHANVKTSVDGERLLEFDGEDEVVLRMPPKVTGALPLLVLFHGAGGRADRVIRRLGSTADEAGVAVLATNSRDSTWDAIGDSFGPDVNSLNRALERVFDLVSVDPKRVAVGGFSDGASYALSLGLINGDLFSSVLAFSPGFVIDGPTHGQPQFYISHGTSDPILPIDHASRRIVAGLRKRGYDVTFREFPGGHEIPPEIAREGTQWVAGH